jgi:hypothetical protein
MPDIAPEELRRMAAAIDADREPRVRVEIDLSAEAAQRVHDILSSVAAEVFPHGGIETSWPLYRLLDALESAASPG